MHQQKRRIGIVGRDAVFLLALLVFAALLPCGALAAAGAAPAVGATTSPGTLDRMAGEKTIRIAYREDAPPFSYKDKSGEPAGYMVDLCREVVKKLTEQLHLTSLNIVYVSVTAVNRFAAIQQHKADLLCGPTSATLGRRKLVDFSIPTFVDGVSLMIRTDGPHDLKAMAGHKIGVLGGTTTAAELRDSLQKEGIVADVITVKTHSEGLAMLDDGKISAYFADRSILASLIKQSRAPDKLMLAENYLTVEPYALALPRGDEDFRLAVDRALSHIYRSGAIIAIFKKSFGENAKPDQLLRAIYLTSGLPD